MQILLVNKPGQCAKILSWRIILLFFLLVIVSSNLITFWFSNKNTATIVQENVHENEITSPSEEYRHIHDLIVEEKQSVNELKLELDSKLNSITLQMARMQASLIHLDTIGQNLVRKSNLDIKEFQFDEENAMGGPQELQQMDEITTEHKMLQTQQHMITLVDEINRKQEYLHILETLVNTESYYEVLNPSGKPTDKGWISSYFGKRKDPFSGKIARHKGIDVAGKSGTDIIATASGIVTWAGKRSGYGLLIEIDHGNNILTRYGHCKEIIVKVNDMVKQGESIGKIGSTGRSTGPHIHYEVIVNDKKVNPLKYVQQKRPQQTRT